MNLPKRKRLYDSALFIGAVGAAIGFMVAVGQATMNLVGFDHGKPTGRVISELRAEVRSNKLIDDSRDSVTNRGLAELRQLLLDNKNATDNNTAILCLVAKSPLPLCDIVLKTRGLK